MVEILLLAVLVLGLILAAILLSSIFLQRFPGSPGSSSGGANNLFEGLSSRSTNCASNMTKGLPLHLVQNASYHYNGSDNSTDFNDAGHYLSLIFSLQDSNTNQTMTHVTYYVEIIDEKTDNVMLAEMFHSHAGPITIRMEDIPGNTNGELVIPSQRDATTKAILTDADGLIHVKDSRLLENGSTHIAHIVVRGLNSDSAELCSDAGMPRYDLRWSFNENEGLSLVRENR